MKKFYIAIVALGAVVAAPSLGLCYYYNGHHGYYHGGDVAAGVAGGFVLGATIGAISRPAPVYVAPAPQVYVEPPPGYGGYYPRSCSYQSAIYDRYGNVRRYETRYRDC